MVSWERQKRVGTGCEAVWVCTQAALARLWKPGWCVGAEVLQVVKHEWDDTS